MYTKGLEKVFSVYFGQGKVFSVYFGVRKGVSAHFGEHGLLHAILR